MTVAAKYKCPIWAKEKCPTAPTRRLPFPPSTSSCIAASRQGSPPAQKQAALTAPGRDATRTPERREWQDSAWRRVRKTGHFYFAGNRTFLLCSDSASDGPCRYCKNAISSDV